jgi:hypothetical protein
VAIFRKPRGGAKRTESEHEHPKRDEKDPLHDAHVHSPRWRPPISATPEEEEATQSDAEAADEDDTLEFERPRTRPLI